MQYSFNFNSAGSSLAALSNTADFTHLTPLSCLHGWLDNAASFIPLTQQFANLPMLAIEFPGHGHSTHRSSDAHYYFFDWIQDIVQLCRQQNWQQLTIIGHSMGAMVATALAAAFPELVAKLVLIDSLGFVTDTPAHSVKQLRDGVLSRLKPAIRKPNYADINEAAFARQKQSDFSLVEAMLLAKRGTIASDKGITWRADMRLRHSSVYRLSPEQAIALMSAVTCPTLAVIAQDGPFYSKVNALAKHYQQLQIALVMGGHHCHMTEAEAVAEHIQQFLAQ